MNISDLNIQPRDYSVPKFHEVKVIGVGGAGKNAINNLKKLEIRDIDLIALNTDAADLDATNADYTILLGPDETGGNGAGNDPEVGKRAAMEVLTQIEEMLDAPTISRIKNNNSTTQMVFIVAGMGGGTGTGAAPVVAKLCRDRDILTVGVVVTPQKNEGNKRLNQAILGMKEMQKYVDSLMVVDNQKMVDVFPDYPYDEVLAEGDMVLATAVKAVSDVITKTYNVNIDFKDIKSTLGHSQFMTVGTARRGGANRATEVVDAALNSPLLKDNCIIGAKRAIIVINYNYNAPSENKPTTKEIDNIYARLNEAVGLNIDKINGRGNDESLENDIEVIVMVSDFKGSQDFLDEFEIKLTEFNNALENNDIYLAWELISELKKLNNHLEKDLSCLIEKLDISAKKTFETKVANLENSLNTKDISEKEIKEIEEELAYLKIKILPVVIKILPATNTILDNLYIALENKKEEIKYLPKYNNLKAEIETILKAEKADFLDIQDAKTALKQIEYDIAKLKKYIPKIENIINNLSEAIKTKEENISKLIVNVDDNGKFDINALNKMRNTKIDEEISLKEKFGEIKIEDFKE